MPIFIPDRLKTPGDFPSIDANDNQIRGFGFFADNAARTALGEDFRCEGYLAFMKDTDQFKQYNNTVVDDDTWGNDSNWVLLEGQQTDTYWAADADGAGIYYSNQVIVGASTHGIGEIFYVNGTSRINGALKVDTHLQTPQIQSLDGLDIIIDINGEADSGDDFKVQYKDSGSTRTALDISPYTSTASIAFGNIFEDFTLNHYSSSFSEFRTVSANANETGFKFTDFAGADGVMLFRMKTNDSYLELSDGGRKVTTAPHTYKIFSTVEADADVTHAVEMLMPDSATGDWTFNHLGNKNYVFNTNTAGSSKLITKFHAAGNGVVSIGTANYYNEYNGIQYPSYNASLQPRLFIVNDGTSNVGVRVQSGDITLGVEGERTQGRYWTDMRDDGFYISRNSTGPSYDDSDDVIDGDEWLPSGSGNPSAVIGMRRYSGGNSLDIFARNNLYYTSGGSAAFSIVGDPNADERDLILHSPQVNQALRIKVRNDDVSNGDISFISDNIGTFLIAKGNENVVELTGKLGVGTAAPEGNLHVYEDAAGEFPKVFVENGNGGGEWLRWSAGINGSTLKFSDTGGFGIGPVDYADKDNTDVPTAFWMKGDGNIGIGTSSPSAKLEIEGTLKSKFGVQNISGTDDMSIYNLTDNTGYIRLITTHNGSQREGLRVLNSGLTQVNHNLQFGAGSNSSNSIKVSRPIFTIQPVDSAADPKIPTVIIGNGTNDGANFTISGSGSIFESNFLIGHANHFGFRSPRSSGWIQTNTAKVLSANVTNNVDGDVDTQFWATDTGVTTNHMTLHKDGRLSLTHKTSSVSIGKDAGLAVGDDMYNVSIGYQANRKDSLGFYNVYIGRDAGPLTYSQGETMTGEWVDRTKAINSDVFVQGTSPEPSADYKVHDYNIGIGFQALKNNQSTLNIGIGYRAGAEYVHQFGVYTDVDTYLGNTSADGGHIFIGNQAAANLVRANVGVVAIGEMALNSWVQGEGSIVAVGRNAMGPVTSTTRTTAIGNNALALWSDGNLQASYSTAVGSSAAANLTQFNNSVAIGETCLNSAKNRYFLNSGGWNTAGYGDNAFPWFDRSSEHVFDNGVAIGKGIGINSILRGSILMGYFAAQNSRIGTGTISIGAYSSQQGANAGSVVIGREAERYNDNAVDAVSIGFEVAADKGQHFVANSSEDYSVFNSISGTEMPKKFRLSWGFHDDDTVNYGETSNDDYYITPPFYSQETGGTAIYQATGTQSSATYGGVNFLRLGYFDQHIGFRSSKFLMFSSGRNVSIGSESLGGGSQGAKQLRVNVDWSSLITSTNSGYTEGTYEFIRVYKRSLGKGRDRVKASVSDQSSTDLWIDEDHHYAQGIRMRVTVNSSGVITELLNPGGQVDEGNYVNQYGGQIHVDDELYIPADGLYSGSSEVVFKLTSSQTITDYLNQVYYFGDDDSHLEMLGGGAGDNVAIGHQSLYRITGGHGNIALGSRSGNEIHLGSHNILIGSRAGYHLAGDDASGNVIIGSYRGTTNMSDKLVISQTGTSNVTTPLIEGTFTSGSEEVKINGDLEIPSSSDGLILKDSNDVRYRVTVNTSGGLVVTSL